MQKQTLRIDIWLRGAEFDCADCGAYTSAGAFVAVEGGAFFVCRDCAATKDRCRRCDGLFEVEKAGQEYCGCQIGD